MAPVQPVKKAQDRRVQQVFDTARKTVALLQDHAELPAALGSELETVITKSFPISPGAALVGKAPELDSLGSDLWNSATSLFRAEEDILRPPVRHPDTTRLVVLVRYFAYLLIDTAHQFASRRQQLPDQEVRAFKIALKTCRLCLERGELSFGFDIFKRWAEFVGKIEAVTPVVSIADDQNTPEADRQHTLKRLVCKYHLLRMTHHWKSDRFDLVDHSYAKLDSRLLADNADLGEKAADLFYEAGKLLLAQGLHDAAIKWCERSTGVLNSCDVEKLSPDAPELRLAATSTLVDCLLVSQDQGSRAKASSIIEQLDTAHGLGNRTAMYFLRFNVLAADPHANPHMMYDTLSRIIVTSVMSGKTFKLIMQTIHKARKISALCALGALNDFITKRLLPDVNSDVDRESIAFVRLEKAMVTYVLFATSQSHGLLEDKIASLQRLFDDLVQRCDHGLSARATHAAQTLIWKMAGSSDLSMSNQWCTLLRHPVFANAGHINKARVWRKAMQSALGRNDLDGAREVFYSMPNDIQNDGLTRYLTFKLALRCDDPELASECLAIITKSASQDATLLFACVLDAQQSGVSHMATMALQNVLDTQPPGSHLPSLLRVTVRLLIGQLEATDRSFGEIMGEIIRMFETAATNTKALRQGTEDQWRAEIQWWSKNSYNLALRHCAKMHPEHLTRLLMACSKFLECYPTDGGLMHQDDVTQRKMLCHFLCACAMVVLGRSGDSDREESSQYYLNVREHVASFQSFAANLEPVNEEDRRAMSARLFELLKFNLEAIFRLKQWDHVDPALQAFLDFSDADCWESVADILLIIYEHANAAGVDPSLISQIPAALGKCINESWKKNKDIVKMSRWFRLTFLLHSSSSCVARKPFALTIVEQAAEIARKGSEQQHDAYPETELQWLATSAFNMAIDLMAVDDYDGAKPWVEVALEMARYSVDNGLLHANLTTKKEMATLRREAGAGEMQV